MLVQSPVVGDARVVREATTLSEAGHRVTVVGREVPAGGGARWPWQLLSVGRAGGLGSASGGRAGVHGRVLDGIRWLLLPTHVRRVEAAWSEGARALVDAEVHEAPDVVHAHDLNTLALGAELADRFGARLVYDAHELWMDRPRAHRPTPVAARRWARQERRLGRRADAVLTVGEGVARELEHRHGWDHVTVVRNTFPPLAEAGPLVDVPTGLVYAGRIAADRELEVLVRAADRLPRLDVTAVGPSDPHYLRDLRTGRVRVRGALDVEEVDDLLRRSGLAVVTHSDRWLNHRLAMPNKLFHAVRAGVPVVATDVGELARVVRRHDLGVLYRPGDAASMVDAVRSATQRYDQLVASVAAARRELSWDRDATVLRDVYSRLEA